MNVESTIGWGLVGVTGFLVFLIFRHYMTASWFKAFGDKVDAPYFLLGTMVLMLMAGIAWLWVPLLLPVLSTVFSIIFLFASILNPRSSRVYSASIGAIWVGAPLLCVSLGVPYVAALPSALRFPLIIGLVAIPFILVVLGTGILLAHSMHSTNLG
jgi:hypothetical protein